MAGEQRNDGPGQRPPHCSPLRPNGTAWATRAFDSVQTSQGQLFPCRLGERTAATLKKLCSWLSSSSLFSFSRQCREISINYWNLKRLQSSLPRLGIQLCLASLFGVWSYRNLNKCHFIRQFSPCWRYPVPITGQTHRDPVNHFLSFDKLLWNSLMFSFRGVGCLVRFCQYKLQFIYILCGMVLRMAVHSLYGSNSI